jgi:hypothetical protein
MCSGSTTKKSGDDSKSTVQLSPESSMPMLQSLAAAK